MARLILSNLGGAGIFIMSHQEEINTGQTHDGAGRQVCSHNHDNTQFAVGFENWATKQNV